MLTPIEISTKTLWDSVFRNSECETILRNIILLQKKVNPNEWTPFTWEDYKNFCTHNVSLKERGVLNTFVEGGRPVSGTTAIIESGWLSIIGDRYFFTDKMVKMLSENYPA